MLEVYCFHERKEGKLLSSTVYLPIHCLLNSFPSPSYTFLLFYMGVKTKFSYFTKGLNNITALCGMCGSDSNNIVFMYDNIDMNDIYFNTLVTT